MLCLKNIELIFPWFVKGELFRQQSTITSHIHEHFIYDHPYLLIVFWSFQVGENSLWIWYHIGMPFYICLCILHHRGIHFCCPHIHPLEYLSMKIAIDANARMIFEAHKGLARLSLLFFGLIQWWNSYLLLNGQFVLIFTILVFTWVIFQGWLRWFIWGKY